jgi:SNF2 family DNA or RNA helicase
MLVLHVHWIMPHTPGETGQVMFWAEDSSITPTWMHGRRPLKPKAHVHPYLASYDRLKETLARQAARQVATLQLPSIRSGPLPSPRLSHTWHLDEGGERFLSPWIVSGLGLSPLDALPLLLDLPRLERDRRNLILAEDARYWWIVTTVALEAMAAQKVIPVIEPGKPGYYARWRPVLDSPRDAQRLAFLEKSQPPVCRAEVEDLDDLPPSARAVLTSFLNSLVDSLARRWSWGEVRNLPAWQNHQAYGWLSGLFRDDPNIKGTIAQLQALDSGFRAWIRNLHLSGDSTFRIAFRLIPPAPGEAVLTMEPVENGSNGSTEVHVNGNGNGSNGNGANGTNGTSANGAVTDTPAWTLQFLLQALDDPSLLVSAEAVWRDTSGLLSLLGRRLEHPQEKLLAGLGYAGRLFPPISEALKSKTPSSLKIDTRTAYAFLRQASPVLEEAGFGLLAPPWWNQKGARLGVKLRLSPAQKVSKDLIVQGHLSLDKIVNYRWELSLGDTNLTEEEFRALAALKTPLVQIRGQWVQLDPEQVEAAIQFWEKQSLEGRIGLLEAIEMGMKAGESENNGSLPVDEVITEDWLTEWLQRFNQPGRLSELNQPPGLHGELRPYQRYGYSWLSFFRQWELGACLADDMGLGKTIQTLALLLREKDTLEHFPTPALLICPTSVVTNWEREIRRFAPGLNSMIHQGPNRLRGEAFKTALEGIDIILTSYPLVRVDADLMQSINWHAVILDEAQNIKNPTARQTQVIRKLPAGFRLALTGTPVENRLSELWSIMHFLNPGYLGSHDSFRANFAVPIERYNDRTATEKLKKVVGPFILRRVKSDPTVIQDLPEKVETKEFTSLTEEQATLYQAVVESEMKEVEDASGIGRRGQVLAMLMKLKQVCNHPSQFLHQIREGEMPPGDEIVNRSGKMGRLVEMMEEILAEGDRTLIFTQFAEMGEMLAAGLPQALGVPVLFLHGGTPAKNRDAMIRQFQEDPDGPPIFILSLKAGGTGLNLTRATHVFHFDRWWNPAVENQATDRAFRIGQKRNVLVHKFITLGTLEERIDEMIESKKGLAEAIVGSGEAWLTELDTDDLRELVTLRKE